MKPVKIFVTGPPASGKTFYSNQIHDYYNLPRVHIKELVDKAFFMAKKAGEEDEGGGGDEPNPLVTSIKETVDRLRTEGAEAKVEQLKKEAEEAGKELEEDPEVDPESLAIRLPNQGILYDLLRERLNENDCRNRGYILDGFPRTFEDCQWIFLKKQTKYDPETGEIIEEEE